MRNTKSLTALGEIPVEMLSDMGSTPIISRTTRPGIRNVFRAFVLLVIKAFEGCHGFSKRRRNHAIKDMLRCFVPYEGECRKLPSGAWLVICQKVCIYAP